MTGLEAVGIIIVAVAVASVVLGLVALGAAKSMERGFPDAKRQRRSAIMLAVIYTLCATYGAVEVLLGDEPASLLLALPIPLLMAWVAWRAAVRRKAPPE